jgi:hypothetical protein
MKRNAAVVKKTTELAPELIDALDEENKIEKCSVKLQVLQGSGRKRR